MEPTSGLVTLPGHTGLDELIAAVDRNWQDAFNAQVATEEYPTAEYLLAAVRSGTLPAADGELNRVAAQTLQTAEHRSQTDLRTVREQLLAELRRARLSNEISEQDGQLTTMLDAADPDTPTGSGRDDPRQRRSLAAVRAQLAEVARLLPAYREEAARRLQDRLERLVEQPARRAPVDAPHIQRLINAGELSTAEELIYYCEVGEPVPHVAVPAKTYRFPGGPRWCRRHHCQRRRGDPQRLLVAGCDVLDFGGLSEHARAAVADALNAWRLLGLTPVEERSRISERWPLLPALRVAGFEFHVQAKANRLDNVQKGRERRFVEVTNVSWNGNPIVPQFGSGLRGRLRVLLCWGAQRGPADRAGSTKTLPPTQSWSHTSERCQPGRAVGLLSELRSPARPSSSSTMPRWPTWPRAANGSLTQPCRSCCHSLRYSHTCDIRGHWSRRRCSTAATRSARPFLTLTTPRSSSVAAAWASRRCYAMRRRRSSGSQNESPSTSS